MSSHKDGNILDTFFGFLGLASELAWPVLTVVFLVLAHRISQDKDMNVQTVLRPAMSKLKTIIGQRFILFFFATLFQSLNKSVMFLPQSKQMPMTLFGDF
jgi:hypothetical protein